MKRREFIALLGGAAAAGRSRRARRSGVRRIGMLLPASRGRCGGKHTRRGVHCKALQQLGWIDGRNVRIDIRWGGGNPERIRQGRGGIGGARAGRHPGSRRHDPGPLAAGDPHRADRVPDRHRSGRRRLRRQPGAAGRQRHRLHVVRIQPERRNGWSCSRRSRRA